MPSQESDAIDLRNQRLNEIIDKVSLHLQERKNRKTLANETQKAIDEINLIEHKIAKVGRRLHVTEQALNDIEPRAIESKKIMTELLKEKTAAETQLAVLIQIENEMEAKLAAFPKLKSDLAHARAAHRESASVFSVLENSCLEAVNKKDANSKKSGELKDKINMLMIEITAVKSTRDMLIGLIPEGFGTDDIDQFSDDFEASILSYTNEIGEEIENVKRQTSDLELQITKEKELESSLSTSRTELQRKIENIKTVVGEKVDKPAIVAELNQLRDQKEKLAKDLVQNSQDMKRMEAESKAVIELLEPQQDVKKGLDKKLTELESMKQKMDATGDLDAEILRLTSLTDSNNMEASVNQNLLATITDIKNDMDSIIEQLRSVIKNYAKPMEDLDNLMDDLLA